MMAQLKKLEAGEDAPYDCPFSKCKMGKPEKVKEVLEEQFEAYKREYVLPSHFAINNLLLDQKDKAIEWFEKAYTERDHLLCYVIGSPITDSIRSDPRFQAILKKMGLETA